MTDRKSKPGGDADNSKHPFGKFIKSGKSGKGASADSESGSTRRTQAGRAPSSRDEDRPARRPGSGGSARDFKRSPRDSERPSRGPGKPSGDFKRSSRDTDRPSRGSDGPSRVFKRSSHDSDGPSRGPGKPSGEFRRSSRDSDRPSRGPGKPSGDFKRSSNDSGRPSRGPGKSAGDFRRSPHDSEHPSRSSGRQDRSRPEAKPEIQQDRPGDEVTFSKTLEDKWATPPVTSRKPPEKKAADRSAPLKRKPKGHYIKENAFEKVYDAEGRKKFTGGRAADSPEAVVPEGEMPLNKYIAHCGVCSRRDAVSLIKDGKVSVNEEVILEPGFKVQSSDSVSLQGKKLQLQHNLVYLLLNKPKGYITTTDDPKGRRTVMDLVAGTIEERVFPVGRLDRNTTGLLLLTNDGQLTQQLAHPKFEVRKVYMVTLDKKLSQVHFDAILNGLELEDGPAPVDELEYLESKNEIGIQIHSGKNRIVRRIFESLGYVVDKLDRVVYAGLTKKNLARGKWRFLTQQEIINLKHFSK